MLPPFSLRKERNIFHCRELVFVGIFTEHCPLNKNAKAIEIADNDECELASYGKRIP